MEMAKHFLFAIYQLCLTLAALVHAQDQQGFISIDCGLVDEPSYRDEATGIDYSSDANGIFINTVVSQSIASQYKAKSLEMQFWNVRSFPEGTRNCHNFDLPRESSSKRLIRARFMYGNYDGKDSLPRFDLYLGPNWWDSLEFENASSVETKEIVHVASSDYVLICLVNRNTGTPFISALEIRILKYDTYDYYQYKPGSLQLLERFDVGLQEDQRVRYPNDVYNRSWTPYNPYGWKQIDTSLNVDNEGPFSFEVPSIFLRTAATPTNASDNLGFSSQPSYGVASFYVYMSFAEIEKLLNNQTREFNVYVNGGLLLGPVSVPFLGHGTTIYMSPEPESKIQIWINTTNRATRSPLLNGIEAYKGLVLNL